MNPISHEIITVSTSVKSLGSGFYNGASSARLSVENPIRLFVDNGIPTSAKGHLLPDCGWLELESLDEIQKCQMIRQGASDATVTITYYQ